MRNKTRSIAFGLALQQFVARLTVPEMGYYSLWSCPPYKKKTA